MSQGWLILLPTFAGFWAWYLSWWLEREKKQKAPEPEQLFPTHQFYHWMEDDERKPSAVRCTCGLGKHSDACPMESAPKVAMLTPGRAQHDLAIAQSGANITEWTPGPSMWFPVPAQYELSDMELGELSSQPGQLYFNRNEVKQLIQDTIREEVVPYAMQRLEEEAR